MEVLRTTYIYTPLDETKRQICLLHLLPALKAEPYAHAIKQSLEVDTNGEGIRCAFSIVSLDDEPQFEALSYVWGDRESDAVVELKGHSRPFTSNLHSALEHLCHVGRRALHQLG
ncbi:uncharacterized protein M421DRAFT_423346 [Didymella exigua CBS 183.55]|uniref:Uncharacterized protein n=1 Tax=Didymella exigua CBS 183.55 TaxID=1150837 RepID=A0A6A5RF29_9PLEO|nr:uncharacterized protein M421DRAFT_423346 [Didymella exigua CBS 183.55]KAF1925788.1 hypothetical protein M421DRAFT_423346 [Didymella exigua CBS 183.55]